MTEAGYEVSVRLFCDYLLDGRYGWVDECVRRFGEAPPQVFHEHNSVVHLDGYEGEPGLRDAAMLKQTYAFGLRRREVTMLDLATAFIRITAISAPG